MLKWPKSVNPSRLPSCIAVEWLLCKVIPSSLLTCHIDCVWDPTVVSGHILTSTALGVTLLDVTQPLVLWCGPHQVSIACDWLKFRQYLKLGSL